MDSRDSQSESAKFCGIEIDVQSPRLTLDWIAIQAIPSQFYLTEDNFWSRDIDMARLFESGAVALKEAARLNLGSFKLIPRRLG